MRLSDVRGHDRVRAILSRALERDRLPPAMLFAGPEGVGKKALALAVAQAALCERAPVPEACGECRPCREGDHRAPARAARGAPGRGGPAPRRGRLAELPPPPGPRPRGGLVADPDRPAADRARDPGGPGEGPHRRDRRGALRGPPAGLRHRRRPDDERVGAERPPQEPGGAAAAVARHPRVGGAPRPPPDDPLAVPAAAVRAPAAGGGRLAAGGARRADGGGGLPARGPRRGQPGGGARLRVRGLRADAGVAAGAPRAGGRPRRAGPHGGGGGARAGRRPGPPPDDPALAPARPGGAAGGRGAGGPGERRPGRPPRARSPPGRSRSGRPGSRTGPPRRAGRCAASRASSSPSTCSWTPWRGTTRPDRGRHGPFDPCARAKACATSYTNACRSASCICHRTRGTRAPGARRGARTWRPGT